MHGVSIQTETDMSFKNILKNMLKSPSAQKVTFVKTAAHTGQKGNILKVA